MYVAYVDFHGWSESWENRGYIRPIHGNKTAVESQIKQWLEDGIPKDCIILLRVYGSHRPVFNCVRETVVTVTICDELYPPK